MTKVFMSRANYQRLLDAGGDPAELDKLIEVYPDEPPAEPLVVDQDRMAATFAALQHPWQQICPNLWHAPAAPSGPAHVFHDFGCTHDPCQCTDRAGRQADAPDPFQQRVQERAESFTGAWMQIAELMSELQDQDDTARRLFLNDVVTGVPAGMRGIVIAGPDGQPIANDRWDQAAAPPLDLDQMREFIRRWADTPWSRRRLIKAGTQACDTFAELASRTSQPKDVHGAVGALAGLTGIPIVPDDDLPPHVWRLVDGETGEVLYENTAPPAEQP